MRSRPAILLWLILLAPTAAPASEPVNLALNAQAELAVVVGDSAPPRVRRAAQTLADYLHKISGGDFHVTRGDGSEGIAVGRREDFPQLALETPWTGDDPQGREDYLLRSHPRGLYLIGSSDLAVEHAVWDLLYRLGHRQFFPGQTWEVIPQRPSLAVEVDVHERPDYLARRIWYGFGPWDHAADAYAQWCARNRCTSGIELRTGHAYDGIIERNQAAFDAHPEYLALVDGQRTSTKLCIANPDLRRLVVQDALARVAQDPEGDSLSMDPSDGPGWCQCEACAALGSISDRALMLANEVAAAVNQQRRGTLVGMYAYSAHSPPPSIAVHPQVVISVATAFIRGGYTSDQLIAGWHQQGATLGVREYFSVSAWDRDLPGRARGSDLEYISRTIPHYHASGARFYSSEASDNWGPNGLGYYLAARLLWDVGQADRVDALVDDFLETCFGAAKAPMAEFYRLIDGSEKPLLSDDLIGRMYRLLQQAKQASDDPAVSRRLDDLVLYTRYVELWFDYDHAQGDQRQAAFEQMIRHVYRSRGSMMVHAKALYRDVARRDKQVAIPAQAAWDVAEEKNSWKSSSPFTRQELDDFLSAGIQHRRLRGFEPTTWSNELVPARPLGLATLSTGDVGRYSRGVRRYQTWVQDPAEPIRLTLTAGRVYQDRGAATVTLHAGDEPAGEPLATVAVPPDGQPHELKLQAPRAGTFTITISDAAAGTEARWPEGQPMTILSSLQSRAEFHGRWTLVFYVPKNTRSVGGYSSGAGELVASDGHVVHRFSDRPGYFEVTVAQGQDGKLWQFRNSSGERYLMTVPPSLARSGEELLLPAEIVQRDGENEP